MEKNTKKSIGILGLVLLVGIAIGVSFSMGKVGASENAPGTIGDPLVSKSYVDAQLAAQVGQQVTAHLSQMDLTDLVEATQPSTPPQTTDMDLTLLKFQVLHLMAGDMLIGGESTEMILRSGSATAIANAAGNGLSDVTSGIDVRHDEEVAINHLLIVPRADNRGLMIQTESYLLIKGSYEVR